VPSLDEALLVAFRKGTISMRVVTHKTAKVITLEHLIQRLSRGTNSVGKCEAGLNLLSFEAAVAFAAEWSGCGDVV